MINNKDDLENLNFVVKNAYLLFENCNNTDKISTI